MQSEPSLPCRQTLTELGVSYKIEDAGAKRLRKVFLPSSLVWAQAARAQAGTAARAAEEFINHVLETFGVNSNEFVDKWRDDGAPCPGTWFLQPEEMGVREAVVAEVDEMEVEDYMDGLAIKLGLKTLAGRRALDEMVKNIQLLDTKQMSYGPNNIRAGELIGLAVRLSDKINRALHILKNHGGAAPSHESLVDTFMDISNYGVISQLWLGGKWTTTEEEQAYQTK